MTQTLNCLVEPYSSVDKKKKESNSNIPGGIDFSYNFVVYSLYYCYYSRSNVYFS